MCYIGHCGSCDCLLYHNVTQHSGHTVSHPCCCYFTVMLSAGKHCIIYSSSHVLSSAAATCASPADAAVISSIDSMQMSHKVCAVFASPSCVDAIKELTALSS